MFGRLRRLKPSSVSEGILRCGFHYATYLGIIFFDIKSNRANGCLVARNRCWYKWLCIVSRILMCSFYCFVSIRRILGMDQIQFIIVSTIRLLCCLVCAVAFLVMQFWYGRQVIRVVNRFLRLFWRVKALPGCQDMGFGGKRELSLLIFKTMCVLYELCCEFPILFSKFDFSFNLNKLCDIYATINAAMISHICFVGYLSVGALYAQVNRYVRHELRRQLRNLEQPNGAQASRRELKAATYRLDQFLAIYEEIQRAGSAFQRLFDLSVCHILLFSFVGMTVLTYFIMLNGFHSIAQSILVAKMLFDAVLLTLAVQGAGSSSKMIRRLSLENCYVSERNDWHIRLEMFLSRLHFYEFRVRPLGLFEISNELILVFLSGLVTYLTYILQFSIQTNKI